MVQSIDARSAATTDRVPSFRLIDLHKVLQQRIFVPGHYAWKVHKLKGIKLHHGRIFGTRLALRRRRSDPGGSEALFHTDGRSSITEKLVEEKNMSPSNDLYWCWSQSELPSNLRSGILAGAISSVLLSKSVLELYILIQFLKRPEPTS